MESIYNKYRLQTLCVIIAALIVALGTVAVTCLYPPAAFYDEEALGNTAPADVINVTVKADGNSMELMAADTTVGQILESHNITLGKNDEVNPAIEAETEDGMEIIIQRIEYKEETVKEDIPYKTETKGTDDLPKGTTKVVQKGEKGRDEVTYKVKYADGEEVSREEISRETVKEPVKEIVLKSTVGTIKGKEYSRKFTVKAYSYTGGGTTASGKPAAVGRIAVDPRVILLGTKVYVEGYGFAEAADTGGNIKGNTIDVYFNSLGQCRQWGVRHVTIYILK